MAIPDFVMMGALQRRDFALLGILGPLLAATARAHNDAGRVNPPLPAPDMVLQMDSSGPTNLRSLLQGRVTALQLMFTGCTATCPIQGALFGQIQTGLLAKGAQAKHTQLLSISIDALNDDPKALAAWLKRQSAHAAMWRAGVPPIKQVDKLFDFLKGRNRGPDSHTSQVYLFNARGQLVLRTVDFPQPHDVLALMLALPKV